MKGMVKEYQQREGRGQMEKGGGRVCECVCGELDAKV